MRGIRSIAWLLALGAAFSWLAGPAAADPKAQFKTERQAQLHCPKDVVVWLNLSTGVYLMKGERWYGRGRHGAFVCKREAEASGNRVAVKGE